MVVDRGSSLRRRGRQQATSSQSIDYVDRRNGKPRRSYFMACRRRVIKLSIWLQSQSVYNVGALLVLLASLAIILLSNSSITTGTGPRNSRTLNVVFHKSRVAGGSTFRSPHNRFKSEIPSYGGIVLDTLDKEHFRREIKVFPEAESEAESRSRHNRGSRREVARAERYAREYGRYDPHHDDDEEQGECRRVKWRSLMFPTCNSFHELDEVNAGATLKYLG
jgi:hypothetical protein